MHVSNSEVTSSTYSSFSEGQETLSKPKHLLKPPKFDNQSSFETFWAQFMNCAEHNMWSKHQKLVYLKSSLECREHSMGLRRRGDQFVIRTYANSEESLWRQVFRRETPDRTKEPET